MHIRSFILASACLLASSSPLFADTVAPSGKDGRVEWNVAGRWQIAAQPVDIVHSLDGKLVYILDSSHRVLIYNAQGQLQGKVPVGEGVTRIDIAPQGETLYLIDEKNNNFTALSMSFVQDIDISGSPLKGNPDALVTLTVFTDFEWPYCGKLEPLLKQVLDTNSENIKLVFKNMPLSFHKMAEPAHRAAMAAYMQGKFWEYHDLIFEAGPKALNNRLFDETAKKLGLNMEKFAKDRNSNQVVQRIRKDMIDAQKAGVTGTPTVFINGRKVSQRTLQGFQALIDEELAKVKK